MKQAILIILSSALVFANGSFGFSSARNMASGGSGISNNDRIYSIHVNPAGLLTNQDSSYLQFSLSLPVPTLALQVNNSAFGSSDIAKYFNSVDGAANVLSAQDEQDIINLVGNSLDIGINGAVSLFRIGYKPSNEIGAFALSVDDYQFINGSIPKEFLELVFQGNEIGRTYNFDQLSFQAAWYRSISLSWAKNFYQSEDGMLKSINAGITGKYIMGISYVEMDVSNASLTTDEVSKITLEYQALTQSSSHEGDSDITLDPLQPLGSGIGLDIGGTAELQNGIIFGLSLTDIGSINWTENVESNKETLVTVIEELTEDEIDSVSAGNKVATGDTEFSTALPTALRFGVNVPLEKFVPMLGELNLFLNYHQGFSDDFANSTAPRLSFGADFRPIKYVGIMAGVGNDRFGNIRTSLGVGLNTSVFDIYIATRDLFSTIAVDQRASLGLSVRWKIFGN